MKIQIILLVLCVNLMQSEIIYSSQLPALTVTNTNGHQNMPISSRRSSNSPRGKSGSSVPQFSHSINPEITGQTVNYGAINPPPAPIIQIKPVAPQIVQPPKIASAQIQIEPIKMPYQKPRVIPSPPLKYTPLIVKPCLKIVPQTITQQNNKTPTPISTIASKPSQPSQPFCNQAISIPIKQQSVVEPLIIQGNLDTAKTSNYISGQDNAGLGTKNTIDGNSNLFVGNSNAITGDHNNCLGNLNQISGDKNSVIGHSNDVTGLSNKVVGSNNVVVTSNQMHSYTQNTNLLAQPITMLTYKNYMPKDYKSMISMP